MLWRSPLRLLPTFVAGSETSQLPPDSESSEIGLPVDLGPPLTQLSSFPRQPLRRFVSYPGIASHLHSPQTSRRTSWPYPWLPHFQTIAHRARQDFPRSSLPSGGFGSISSSLEFFGRLKCVGSHSTRPCSGRGCDRFS